MDRTSLSCAWLEAATRGLLEAFFRELGPFKKRLPNMSVADKTGHFLAWGDQDHSRTIPLPFQDHSRTIPGPEQYRTAQNSTFQDHSRTIPGPFHHHSRTIPGPFQDHSRTIPGPEQYRTVQNEAGSLPKPSLAPPALGILLPYPQCPHMSKQARFKPGSTRPPRRCIAHRGGRPPFGSKRPRSSEPCSSLGRPAGR